MESVNFLFWQALNVIELKPQTLLPWAETEISDQLLILAGLLGICAMQQLEI